MLDISVYDVVRNETARKHRQELEQKLADEEKIRREKEKDYLAPFLARIGDPEVLDKDQMFEVTQVRTAGCRHVTCTCTCPWDMD